MFARAAVRVVLLIACTSTICIWAHEAYAAQDPQPLPKVSFTLDFPGANPSHYEISVGRDGHGAYVSNGQLGNTPSGGWPASSAPADPALDFRLSDRVRDQIFELAQRAHYFSGKVDSGRKNIANTGAGTGKCVGAQRSQGVAELVTRIARDGPFLGEGVIPVFAVPGARKARNVLDDAKILIICLFDQKAVVLDAGRGRGRLLARSGGAKQNNRKQLHAS